MPSTFSPSSLAKDERNNYQSEPYEKEFLQLKEQTNVQNNNTDFARDLNYGTAELLDALPKLWTRGVLYVVICFTVVGLPWATFSKVDETGTAKGRIEPQGATQKIDTQAGGSVKLVTVKAGDKLRLEKKLVKAKDTWTWLEKHHLSVTEFEELVYKNVLSKKLANHLFSAQVEKFFYEHQLDYVAAATYEIIFDNIDLALELFYALEENETTFPDIARLYIEDVELRRVYGYQGIKHRKDFRPEIAAAVFATSPPAVLKPITTPKGVHLIWVEEIIQPQLDKQLRDKIITELFSDWLLKQILSMEIVTQINSDDDLQTQEELLHTA